MPWTVRSVRSAVGTVAATTLLSSPGRRTTTTAVERRARWPPPSPRTTEPSPGGSQLPIGGNIPNVLPMPPGQLAVRLYPIDKELFLAAGARGQGAVYTDYAAFLHIIRKVFLRVSTKLDWLILKLH